MTTRKTPKMGDFADMAIDAMIDGCWGPRLRRPSRRRKPKLPKPTICAFCGTGGLFWERIDGMWRLVKPEEDDYEVHVCPERESAFILKAQKMIGNCDV